jgi:predicted nucleic acid-binding Zn ribbon protein
MGKKIRREKVQLELFRGRVRDVYLLWFSCVELEVVLVWIMMTVLNVQCEKKVAE